MLVAVTDDSNVKTPKRCPGWKSLCARSAREVSVSCCMGLPGSYTACCKCYHCTGPTVWLWWGSGHL